MKLLPGLPLLALALSPAAQAQESRRLPTLRVDAPAARPAAPARKAQPTKPVRRASLRPAAGRARAAGGGAPAALATPAPGPAQAAKAPDLAPAGGASQFSFSGGHVNARPFARAGEALEAAPGLIVTQHSGEGKANQYMLRGFQLDHGTDLAITLDGMPLNMPSHGHGQGYADANFLIPELIRDIRVRKGPWFADLGDFSTAGAVGIDYVDRLDKGLLSATAGSFGYFRVLGAKSAPVGEGSLLAASEAVVNKGPWARPEDLRKTNSLLRWSQGTPDNGLSLTGMAYLNRWNATDQIPRRAVEAGWLPLYGTLNPTDGGDTTRFSLSARWSRTQAQASTRVSAYLVRSSLDLFNDFTYFLANPDLGDQFRQFDRRVLFGLDATQAFRFDIASLPAETRFGFQSRHDDIRVGLQNAWMRQPYSTVRDDSVGETSLALWGETTLAPTPWLKATAGLRVDRFSARVNALAHPWDAVYPVGALNDGAVRQALVSPKAGLVLGPFYRTEFYFNAGSGFHSNDARGATARLDPNDGSPLSRSSLLARSRGAEIGVRTQIVPGLESSLALFMLNLDAENVFEGDAGGTSVGRASRRTGFEWSNHWRPASWLRLDGDLALTRARFRGDNLAAQYPVWLALADYPAAQIGNAPGDHIPEAPRLIASLGAELGEDRGWFAAARLRYIGARALTEDGAFRAPTATLLGARLGYRFDNDVKIQIDGFNLTNSRSDQVTYAYGSLLPTDALFRACQAGFAAPQACAVGVMGRVSHPAEPLSLRLTISGPI